MTASLPLHAIEITLGPLHHKVATHPLFNQINSMPALRCFMKYYAFVVWDSMCLLKILYQVLTFVSIQEPWIPSPYTESIHQIGHVLREEEAHYFPGANNKTECLSNFEAYRRVMIECGANTTPIDTFVAKLQKGYSLKKALQMRNLPLAACRFIENTAAVFKQPASILVAVLIFGREGSIGNLFTQLLDKHTEGQFDLPSTLQYYLKRRIALEGNNDYCKSLRMLQQLCGKDTARWREATLAAETALHAQYLFWEEIEKELQHC